MKISNTCYREITFWSRGHNRYCNIRVLILHPHTGIQRKRQTSAERIHARIEYIIDRTKGQFLPTLILPQNELHLPRPIRHKASLKNAIAPRFPFLNKLHLNRGCNTGSQFTQGNGRSRHKTPVVGDRCNAGARVKFQTWNLAERINNRRLNPVPLFKFQRRNLTRF